MKDYASYDDLTSTLAQGWNTWYVHSMLSHVLLPEGMLLQMGIKEYQDGTYSHSFLKGPTDINPGLRSYDGSYTELVLHWQKLDIRLQTGVTDGDFIALATPLHKPVKKAPLLVVEGGFLWNRPGVFRLDGGVLRGEAPAQTIDFFPTCATADEPIVWSSSPYLAIPLDRPQGLSAGRRRTVAGIAAALDALKAGLDAKAAEYGDLAEVYKASRAVLAWNTVYDPVKKRVITPVARTWCQHGWVLFEWDTYFASYMFSLENGELAMANAVAMTDEITESGFVPNFAYATGAASRDRSEPPVGCWVCREIYRKWGQRWFLGRVYPNLLRWNQWWWTDRQKDGLLAWGSTPYEPVVGNMWETWGVNERFGASLESGLDNSPMYDDVPFDPQTHLLQMWDVGLTSLYASECDALADIARELGRSGDETMLRARGDRVRDALRKNLWDESAGIFCNRRADTGAFSHRLSPTNFYAMLAGAATPGQCERMIREHFYNPGEFWGEWVLPSIARNDPAFHDQSYWRGRIWGPMNFLVYLGLRRCKLDQPRKDLVERSVALLLKNWLASGSVMENYNAITGDGTVEKGRLGGDSFYYWGGLLGTIALMEAGFYDR
ncbi:MAG: MGH1-like glycoside hydrolase domain-containing protein [Kiritimatiellia bacterium]|jgi:putative isomerase